MTVHEPYLRFFESRRSHFEVKDALNQVFQERDIERGKKEKKMKRRKKERGKQTDR